MAIVVQLSVLVRLSSGLRKEVREPYVETNQKVEQVLVIPGCSGWGPAPFVGRGDCVFIVVAEVGVPGTIFQGQLRTPLV
jgi:hypothetical protein